MKNPPTKPTHSYLLDAANARADAAEQSVKNNVERGNGYREAFERAESEAAALRAEVGRLKLQQATAVDHWLAKCNGYVSSLAEARALLQRCAAGDCLPGMLQDDVDAWLAANPESHRAAAERAVLR